MPWSFYSDVDDVIHDWLKSLYTPYRNTLTPTSRLPLATAVDWDAFWAGLQETSFLVYEESTELSHLALGTKTPELRGTQVIRATHRWLSSGKSPVIKEMREFITRTLYENLSPLPTVLTDVGVSWMMPVQSKVAAATNSAQEDYWTVEVRVATKVLNTTV